MVLALMLLHIFFTKPSSDVCWVGPIYDREKELYRFRRTFSKYAYYDDLWCDRAFAISAFPFTSGFVTKSMISYAAADEHLFYVWLGLVAASAGVFLHAGIKFPWFVFFQKDSGLRPPDPPGNMRVAMYILSALCILLGVFPDAIYSILPYEVDYEPYTVSHVLFQLQLLLFAGFAFFVMLPLLKRTQTISLDFDWIARKLAAKSFFLL